MKINLLAQALAVLFSMQTVMLAAPGNDDFANAAILPENSSISGTTVDSTMQNGEQTIYSSDTTVWYKYVAPASGLATFDTLISQGQNSNDYMEIQLFVGDQLGNLISLADDEAQDARVKAIVGNGYTYYVQITVRGNIGASQGTFTLNVYDNTSGYDQGLFQSTSTANQNDNFNNAILLSGTNVKAIGYLQSSTREAGEPSQTGLGSLWWKWICPSNGTTSFSTVGSQATPYLVLGQGDSLAALQYFYTNGSGQDLTGATVAGQTYYISMGRGKFANAAAVLSIVHTPDKNAVPIGRFKTTNSKILSGTIIRGQFQYASEITSISVDASDPGVASKVKYHADGSWTFVASKPKPHKARTSINYTVTAYSGTTVLATVSRTFSVK